jgi:hypothetical protein
MAGTVATSPDAAPPDCSLPTAATVTDATDVCPEPSTVRLVHRWQSPAEGATACTAPTWVVSLRTQVEVPSYFSEGDEVRQDAPRFHALTEAEARTAGIAITNTPLWVFTGDGTPPCQATPGRAWAAFTAAGGPRYVELAQALHGCTFPPNANGPYFAVASPARPTGCSYRAMPSRVDNAPPALPVVRSRTIARPCAAPACASTGGRAPISERGGTLDDVQSVQVFRPAATEAPDCSWPHDFQHTLSWTPRAGSPWVRLLTTGYPVGVLGDRRGLQSVITELNGQMQVFALGQEERTGQRHAVFSQRWYVPSDEGEQGRSLEPSCL